MEPEVEDAADVAVRDLAGQVDLAAEPREQEVVVRQLGAERLEGDPRAQLEVLHLVDLAGAAAGDEPDHAVPSRYQLVGLEGALPLARELGCHPHSFGRRRASTSIPKRAIHLWICVRPLPIWRATSETLPFARRSCSMILSRNSRSVSF